MLTNCLINIYDIKSKSKRMCCKRAVQYLPVFAPLLAFAGTSHALLLYLRVFYVCLMFGRCANHRGLKSNREREENGETEKEQ